MQFPEEELTTYLRAFLPADRIDDVLDQIAQNAIESEVEDPIELFVLAHWLMDGDDRRTDELEAVVLVEEVRLDPEEVAVILGCEVESVRDAVSAAWAEADAGTTATDAVTPAADAGGEADAQADEVGSVPDRGSGWAVASLESSPLREAAQPGRWRRRVRVVGVVLAFAGLGAVAAMFFSEAGQARLLALGFDPLVAFLVIAGFVVGGVALLLASSP